MDLIVWKYFTLEIIPFQYFKCLKWT